MATKAAPATQTGYDYQFIEEPSNDLKCLICLCVARDPQQHGGGGCGKIFCGSCIENHKKGNSKCPNCRTDCVTFKDVRSKQILITYTYRNIIVYICTGERDIQSLKIKCANQQDGCQWNSELRALEDHLKTCEYTMMPCPNECTYIEAKTKKEKNFTILHKNLSSHLEECPRRDYTCPHCEETGEYEDITEEHFEYCPKVEIKCPNAPDCQITLPRADMPKHTDMCPYEEVSCIYKGFGCKETTKRKDIKEHENDDKVHLQITMKTVLKQQREIAELKTQVQAIQNSGTQQSLQASTTKQHMLRLTCKLTKFAEKKEKNMEFESNSFYTHPNGYKMILSVDGNGYNKYKGTHVSVWVYLMRGEYDDQLEFPFKGTITFELLNQLEDNNHHSDSYSYGGTEDSKRVMHREQSEVGSGVPAFIPHKDLDYNNSKNCQYLKDDCLIFRVSVSILSYKPWLHCP